MPTDITLVPTLIFCFYSLLFGLFFAVGGWLWAALVAALKRGP